MVAFASKDKKRSFILWSIFLPALVICYCMMGIAMSRQVSGLYHLTPICIATIISIIFIFLFNNFFSVKVIANNHKFYLRENGVEIFNALWEDIDAIDYFYGPLELNKIIVTQKGKEDGCFVRTIFFSKYDKIMLLNQLKKVSYEKSIPFYCNGDLE